MPQNLRTESYGQSEKFSLADKLGIYLSGAMVSKFVSGMNKPVPVMLDLGCGYNALLLRKFAPLVSLGVGVDVAVNPELSGIKNLQIYEEPIEKAFARFSEGFADIILMISVLEHLSCPLTALKECRRILKNGGLLLVNVPTWRGKFFLETSAFKLGLSPKSEMDNHKMYYDLRDLWPILVQSGFMPSQIEARYYKFGLNLFAACKK